MTLLFTLVLVYYIINIILSLALVGYYAGAKKSRVETYKTVIGQYIFSMIVWVGIILILYYHL
jgi:hypothetical protein